MTAALAAPEDRGRLDIDPTVLRKIVEHAADGVPGTLRHGRSFAGIDVGETGSSAKVTVGSGDPSAVDIRLELTLLYPATVRDVVESVRTAVTGELERISGHHVRALTVTVAGLRGPTAAPAPRLI